MRIKTRETVMAGLMIAVAAILAQYPINGSIGLDAMPAFFAAVLISPVVGGLVGIIAHMLIAIFTGMPLSLPLHLVVALTMYVSCFAYGYARMVSNRYIAVALAIVLNGPVALLVTSAVAMIVGAPLSGVAMFALLVGPLTVTAAANVLTADLLYGIIGHRIAREGI